MLNISTIYLSAYIKKGKSAEDALRECFSDAAKDADTVVIIEPGEYTITGEKPILLSGDTKILAHGAVFSFPTQTENSSSFSMFRGENISDFSWEGGKFTGHVYDPDKENNTWEPHIHTSCIEIFRKGSDTRNLRFSHIEAENIAGPVVHIRGEKSSGKCICAENIDITDCHFHNCGHMMWDYGYLWQNIVFEKDTPEYKVKQAYKYMPKDVMSSALRLEDGKLYAKSMPLWNKNEKDSVTLFGENLPEGICRGKRYFIVNEGAENGLVLSETYGGNPISIPSIPDNVRLFRNMFSVYRIYFPVGSTSFQKGCIETAYCRNISITGCRFSALGDSMHILECENTVFANNQILGARMGALYIGFFCKNVAITGNTIYGANGSRVVSIEQESEDVVICGNTFVGGGRGSWFNHPKNIIISNNIFRNNTNKCKHSLDTGRISYATGNFECYPELYFTTADDSGDEYGPIIISDNIIETHSSGAAIAFNPGGKNIIVKGNSFRGDNTNIHVANGCETPCFADNTGMGEVLDRTFFNPANVK